ncbi:hypothetical protein BDV98DRAFT_598167 [Pterulicium gracile]|uniref:Retrotransposon gag domain-containing protein n=1 Tax=Pterulicium gracile TaxID=1884261 RepID=A0A5C3Q3W2_9AGAR|nr:hypothetical protein BDV98DRAFT_598167 [Pterula gracilis]
MATTPVPATSTLHIGLFPAWPYLEPGDTMSRKKTEFSLLWQGNCCVSDYAAAFQELCIGTDRLDTNNRDCFLEHLNKDVKDNLVAVEGNKKDTLVKLINKAIWVDD